MVVGGGLWWLVVGGGWWLVVSGGWWLVVGPAAGVLFFLSLVALVVTTVDAGSVWDIAFFDPKEVYLGVFLVFGTSPTRQDFPAKCL